MKSFIASLIVILCVATANAQSIKQDPPTTTRAENVGGQPVNSPANLAIIANTQTSSLTTQSAVGASAKGDVATNRVQTATAGTVAFTTADLITTTENARNASEDLQKLQQENVAKLSENLTQLQQLYSEGLIARVELEKAQDSLADAKEKVTQTANEIASSTQLAAEIKKASELAKVSPTKKLVKPVLKAINLTGATVMRSPTGSWSIANLSRVQQFFSSTFGRALPVSTIGQSATHNRMGWDHRNSVDVGIHPDSEEGRALMSYLQMNGIPFLAFRAAVPGVSTGPHIHIGFPSHRME